MVSVLSKLPNFFSHVLQQFIVFYLSHKSILLTPKTKTRLNLPRLVWQRLTQNNLCIKTKREFYFFVLALARSKGNTLPRQRLDKLSLIGDTFGKNKGNAFALTKGLQGITPLNEGYLSKNLGKIVMYLMNAVFTLLLINRWITSGHLPLSNLYESLIFLSWSFTTIYSVSSFFLPATVLPTLGSSIAPITLLTSSFAFFCVPQDLQKAQSLVPALQSNWLIMHVSVMILSYASLLLGSLFALTVLFLPVRPFAQKNKPLTLAVDQESPQVKQAKPELPLVKEGTHSSFLDNISYRFIGLGFVLLTMGIISGAVWANSAWGSYWSWDPKETWAFITWLTYAFYLHLRISKGWHGKQSAGVAIFGFFIVWFCYLGVNLFGKGLHSYAFV